MSPVDIWFQSTLPRGEDMLSYGAIHCGKVLQCMLASHNPVAQFLTGKWQLWPGISGNLQPEQVASLARNLQVDRQTIDVLEIS